MQNGLPPTPRARRAWFDFALFIGLSGVALAAVGLRGGEVVMVVSGAAATILAGIAMALYFRLDDGPFRTRKALHMRLAVWAAAAPLGVAVLGFAVLTSTPEITHVAGKPVEVRSDSRQVFMPDGRDYIFHCGGSGRNERKDCPALAKWRALPRWPEPEHVEMEVSGQQIRALRMDGVVIVDRKADDRDMYWLVMLIVIGLALIGGAGLGVRHVVKQLAALKSV